MIEPQSEQTAHSPRSARRLAGNPAFSTLHYWRQIGIHGIKFETCLIGDKRYTSVQALQRFVDNVTTTVDKMATCPKG